MGVLQFFSFYLLLIFLKFHATCFDHVHFSLSTFPRSHLLFPLNSILYPFENLGAPFDQFVLFKYSWICGLPLPQVRLTRGCTFKEHCLSLSSELDIANSYTRRGAVGCTMSPSVLEFVLAWAHTGLMNAVTTTVLSSVQTLCCVRKTTFLSYYSPLPARTFSLPPFLQWSQGLVRGKNAHVPFMTEHSVVFYFLHIAQLWIFVLIINYWK